MKGSGLVLHLSSILALQMARPLRIEFAGALYYVTSRGDGQEEIYRQAAACSRCNCSQASDTSFARNTRETVLPNAEYAACVAG